ncbi:MAG: 8-amino-7-oxononanoate synthase [Candidatus Omnitrophica bacterium]|nr:8-amino-7-oxononanoate synthase [Candidatus Omnitrophota bacterium]
MINVLLEEELETFRQKGLIRKLRTLSDCRGTHAFLEGRELILFCGNDYLGLSHDPRVIEAAREALATQGVGAGAARLISGTTEFHTRLESELAKWMSTERALVFGAGYLANLGVLTALAGEKDLVVMDKLSHASLIDGARLSGATFRVFPHKNLSRLEEILKSASGFRRRVIVTDAVFSMDGDRADLEGLVSLKERYDSLLIVDEAHALGIFGNRGSGLSEERGLENPIDVRVGTLSKALGVFGGFAAASETLIESLVNFSRPFIFATAPPPALAAAALKALEILQSEPDLRKKLWQNVKGIGDRHLWGDRQTGVCSPIIPIIIGDEKRTVEISERLLEKGILIPAIRYPTVPRGKARLRLTVSAAHTEADLNQLFQALPEVFNG